MTKRSKTAAAPTLEQVRATHTIVEMAKTLGLKPNSLYVNFRRVQRNPGSKLPPELIIRLCRAYGIAPHTLDAHLWPNPDWRF
jgi:hypothetical protein